LCRPDRGDWVWSNFSPNLELLNYLLGLPSCGRTPGRSEDVEQSNVLMLKWLWLELVGVAEVLKMARQAAELELQDRGLG